MNLLDYIPFGYVNAIKRDQLCRLLHVSDRAMRKMIEATRAEHAIVNLEKGDGYFQPTPEEKPLVELWYGQQSKRSRSALNSTLGARKWLAENSGHKVTVVREHIRHLEMQRECEGQLEL